MYLEGVLAAKSVFQKTNKIGVAGFRVEILASEKTDL
jgi:hypothetical protein